MRDLVDIFSSGEFSDDEFDGTYQDVDFTEDDIVNDIDWSDLPEDEV